jgi:hypothetical protein
MRDYSGIRSRDVACFGFRSEGPSCVAQSAGCDVSLQHARVALSSLIGKGCMRIKMKSGAGNERVKDKDAGRRICRGTRCRDERKEIIRDDAA